MPTGSASHGLVEEIERFVTGAVHRTELNRVLASVLFTDIVASTMRAAELGDRAWREVLERHDALVERTVSEHGGRVVKHIGDGALSAFDGPAMAMRCAEALNEGVAELGIQLRSGIHTGECELIGEDLGGLAVHIGARVGALAGPGEIVVSSTVKELVVGSDMQFTDRGEHELKGVPGAWRLYALGAQRTPLAELEGRPRTCDAQTASRSRSRAGCRGRCASRDSWRRGAPPRRRGRTQPTGVPLIAASVAISGWSAQQTSLPASSGCERATGRRARSRSGRPMKIKDWGSVSVGFCEDFGQGIGRGSPREGRRGPPVASFSTGRWRPA